jgi:hypothetical protein
MWRASLAIMRDDIELEVIAARTMQDGLPARGLGQRACTLAEEAFE